MGRGSQAKRRGALEGGRRSLWLVACGPLPSRLAVVVPRNQSPKAAHHKTMARRGLNVGHGQCWAVWAALGLDNRPKPQTDVGDVRARVEARGAEATRRHGCCVGWDGGKGGGKWKSKTKSKSKEGVVD